MERNLNSKGTLQCRSRVLMRNNNNNNAIKQSTHFS
jgi:hypothetical protein